MTATGLADAFAPDDRDVLRTLFDTIIPADEETVGGWDGGVARLLDEHLQDFMSWALSPLRHALADLEKAGFCDTASSHTARERLLAELPEQTLGALLRIAYEGYYAGTSAPAGWTTTGFTPVPPGVSPLDPDPALTIRPEHVRPHYDVIVVGAGAGGVVAARELAAAGRDVLLVERGANHRNSELRGNHLQGKRAELYQVTAGAGQGDLRILEQPDGTTTTLTGSGSGQAYGLNAMTVGGGTRLWQGMAWRFYPEDFKMASTYGVPAESTLADWPFGYDELATYYDQVEQQLGVSGDATSPMAARTPRTGPYPMPALPDDMARARFGQAAARLGWDTSPIPFAINSVPRDGRAACVRCAQCVGHACPVDAKNGTQNTFLPRALATGNCSLLTDTRATQITHDGHGRATGVRLVTRHQDTSLSSELQVTADVVVVATGAIETPRLLLASGLGNEWVGRNHHSHGIAMASALGGPHVKSTDGPGHSVATVRFVHGQQKVWGGGVMFDLPAPYPLLKAQVGQFASPPVRLGHAHKAWMRDSRVFPGALSMVQEIPHATARVGLDPQRTDALGMPVARLAGTPHSASVEAAQYMADRCREWVEELGGESIFTMAVPGAPQGAEHSAGTARLGADPRTSACDPTGLLWNTANVYVADASLHPTNGGFNPALTVMANAMRVAQLMPETRR
ncbi:GMC family oxidoreductase N-terminal domain-containing protein [Streptomyces sp. ALB3]|uniref:GMC family oxidoreductase N-terminal domain-containing protein n=1 Tax=Streptomyces sp. ALB3 TaxID=3374278 RepID=UPI0037A87D96